MTKFDFRDSIKAVHISIHNDGCMVILEERKLGNILEKNIPCSKHTLAYTNYMNRKIVNLIDAANYLITLFYRVDKEYTCTRTKIGKLLSIVAFKYAKNGILIFDEIIYKYNNCGTAFAKIMDVFERDIFPRYRYNDDTRIIDEPLKSPDTISDVIDRYNYTLDENVQSLIEEVFRLFGAYSPEQLGECINTIINCDGVVNENGEVNLEKINELQKDSFKDLDLLETNLIEYIFN